MGALDDALALAQPAPVAVTPKKERKPRAPRNDERDDEIADLKKKLADMTATALAWKEYAETWKQQAEKNATPAAEPKIASAEFDP